MDYFSKGDFEIKEYAIGGKLVTMRLVIGGYEAELLTKEQIKQKMASQLAQAMVDNKLIEFTKLVDPMTANVIIHGRCYVAPNEQVKIIRELKDGRF